jgi:eukaryotic-like serine/threonine-protein kinase
MTPDRIGRYEILRPLGKGAMGVVYLARDPQIERELALKTIRFEEGDRSFNPEEAKARFLKEARISGRLQHPHIVTVFDVGEDGGTLYLAMELVQGGSLSQRLAEPESLSVFDRVRIVAEVAEALGHAHERGVLHRDVKPANILLTPEGSAKVTDFGIGKLLTGDTELTSTGQMVGSPAYMSPEQIKGEKLDARTDIFSLGVVLYQALTLRKPFPADTLTTLVYQILHEEPPDPSLSRADLPVELSPVVRKCLEKNRDRRYASASELAVALRAVLGESPVLSTAGITASRMRTVKSAAAVPAVEPTAPTVATATPVIPPPPATTPMESESPTITTGRRMGDVARAAEAQAASGRKRSSAPLAIGAVLLALLAVAMFAVTKKKGAPAAGGPVAAEPAPTVPLPAPPAAAPATTGAGEATPAPAAAGAVAVVPPAPASATTAAAPPKKPPKTKPLPTAGSAAAVPAVRPVPSVQPATPTPRADVVLTSRRLVKVNVSPSQARVFLDGRYIGISDDWDDAGGGTLLSFPFEGTHRLRMTYPGYRDLNVEVQILRNATEDKVEIERDLEKGAPDGPLGPPGKFRRPNYRTVRGAVFVIEPPDALVSVDGKDLGPASKWTSDELVLDAPAVHEVTLSAPDREPLTIRLLVANTAGEFQARIKEKLKKSN